MRPRKAVLGAVLLASTFALAVYVLWGSSTPTGERQPAQLSRLTAAGGEQPGGGRPKNEARLARRLVLVHTHPTSPQLSHDSRLDQVL